MNDEPRVSLPPGAMIPTRSVADLEAEITRLNTRLDLEIGSADILRKDRDNLAEEINRLHDSIISLSIHGEDDDGKYLSVPEMSVAMLRKHKGDLEAEIAALKMSLAGRDKAIELLNKGMESQCEEMDRLKQSNRKLRLALDVAQKSIRNVRDNYDHEEYTSQHRDGYGGKCRMCEAENAMTEIAGLLEVR